METRSDGVEDTALDTGLARDLFRREALNALNEASFIDGSPRNRMANNPFLVLCIAMATIGLFTTAFFYQIQMAFPVEIIKSAQENAEWHMRVPNGLSDDDVLTAVVALPVGKGLSAEHPFGDLSIREIRADTIEGTRVAILDAPALAASARIRFEGLLYAGSLRPIDLITGHRQ